MFVIFNQKTKKYLKDESSPDSHTAKITGNYGVRVHYTKEKSEAKKYKDWNSAFEFLMDHRSSKLEILPATP